MISLVDNVLEGFVNLNGSISAKIISKERKKEIKNNIVEWAYHQFEKLPLSMKSIGILIRSFHMASPIGFFMIMFFSPSSSVCLFTLGVLVVIAFSFFFFDTCMVSSLENRIIGVEFNIIDPVLELLDMDISFMNRLKISYGIGCFYIFAIFCLYIVRFQLKDITGFIKNYKSNKREEVNQPQTKEAPDIEEVIETKKEEPDIEEVIETKKEV